MKYTILILAILMASCNQSGTGDTELAADPLETVTPSIPLDLDAEFGVIWVRDTTWLEQRFIPIDADKKVYSIKNVSRMAKFYQLWATDTTGAKRQIGGEQGIIIR